MTLACSEVLFSLCICLVSWQLLELYEDMNYFRYAQPQLFVCECLLKLMNAPASAKLRKSREGRSTSGLAIIEWDIKSSRLLGCIQIITESNTPCLFVKFHKLPNPGLAQAADCGGVTESEVMMIWSQAWVSLLSVLDNVLLAALLCSGRVMQHYKVLAEIMKRELRASEHEWAAHGHRCHQMCSVASCS